MTPRLRLAPFFILATALGCALPTPLRAQPAAFAERGLPAFEAFGPEQHGGEAQSWAFVQTPDGTLFVGNDAGVLVYDGVRWQRIRLPRGTVGRSLDVDTEGRVWVGAQGDVGYLAPDSLGRLGYVSLVDRLNAEHRTFGDVWGTAATTHGVYFLSGAHLARWHQERFTVEPAAEGARFVFLLRPEKDNLLVSESGPEGSGARGLLRVVEGRLAPVPGGDAFAQRTARLAAPHPDGLLVGDDAHHLRILSPDGTLTPFPTEADPLLAERRLFFGRTLPDGRLAVWTYGGGLALLDQNGRLLDLLDGEAGLPSPLTYTVFPDREGGLWLGQNTGIVRLPPTAPERFDRRNGLTGSPRTIRRAHGTLYAATDLGVFRLRPADGTRRAAFEPVPGLAGEAWSVVPFEDALLAGLSDGVYRWRDGRAERLSRHPARVLTLASGGIVLAGNAGVWRLQQAPNGWTETLLADLRSDTFNSVAVEENGTIWLGTTAGGVVRLSGGTTTRFGSENGLPDGFAAVTLLGDRLLVTTLDGPRRFENGRFEPDARFGAEVAAGSPPIFGTASWGEDVVAAFGMPPAMRLAWMRHQPEGTFERATEDPFARLGPRDLTELHIEPDGRTWLGTTDGILRFFPEAHLIPPTAVRLAAVYARTDSLLYGGFGPADLRLSPDTRALRFAFAAPTFGAPVRFRSRLDGMERDWTPWTDEPQRDVTNLAPGRYTLHVEAMTADGVAAEPGAFTFVIRPPWYGTRVARWAWALLAVGLIGFVARRGPDVARRVWNRLPHRRMVSHYRLDALLGTGGAGQVWRARNLARRPGEPRDLALKLLHDAADGSTSDATATERLRREADLIAAVEHPGVVRVYETGVWKGTPFVAMELIEGETLRQRIANEGPMPLGEAVAVLTALAEALGAVHDAGIVHRDVKSDNVMLTRLPGGSTRAVLMDFGLARTRHLRTLTQLGQLLGTLGYAAPEQALGHEADARSDVFALGVVMVEVLTGRLPFRADNEIALLQAIFSTEPVAPRAVRPDVPEWLDRLALACLAKEPDERPASARAVADRLRAGAEHVPA